MLVTMINSSDQTKKKKNAHFFLLSSKLHEEWKTRKNTNLQIIGSPSFPNTSSHSFPRSHGCIMLYHRVSHHQRHFLSHNQTNLVKNVANLPPPVPDHPSPCKTSNKRKPNWKRSQNLVGRRWKKRAQSLPLTLTTHLDDSSSSLLACTLFIFSHSLTGGSKLSFKRV